MPVPLVISWLASLSVLAAAIAAADSGVERTLAERLLQAASRICDADDGPPPWAGFPGEIAAHASAPLTAGEAVVGNLVVRRHQAGGALRGGDIEYGSAPGTPEVFVVVDGRCRVRAARRIERAEDGSHRIVALDGSLRPGARSEPGNPPVPAGPVEDGIRVALVDSGVDYTLPVISGRLARDGGGALIGYDFWDLDSRPFDANPARSVFFPQRHGTRTASILLAEAPQAVLVPYRYPRVDMTRMRDLVQHAMDHQVAVAAMPLGGSDAAEWRAFGEALARAPEILFVVSAGNDGRDIDRDPVYPAALDAPNLVTVTSSDDFGRPAERVNWGRRSVDLMLPAERLPAIHFGGEQVRVSGSSYAVARLAALAARLKAASPELDAAALKAALFARAIADPSAATVHGWIPDPLSDIARVSFAAPVTFAAGSPGAGVDRLLDLDLLVASGSGWTTQAADAVATGALALLAQCGIGSGERRARGYDASDYLLDLSVGGARTLLAGVERRGIAVMMVRDSEMNVPFEAEAFGRSNTATRPWLRDTVWMVSGGRDPSVALAHELVHVLADSGRHETLAGNLMAEETRPGATELTPGQCRNIRERGEALGLLRIP